MQMGVTPEQLGRRAGRNLGIRRCLRDAGIVHDAFFAILLPPVSEPCPNRDNRDGSQ